MTTKPKQSHTPGPWSIVRVHGGIIGVGKEIHNNQWEMIVNTINFDEKSKANATLISMAPDLLDLLKRINYAFYVEGTSKALKTVMTETKQAISKATGTEGS